MGKKKGKGIVSDKDTSVIHVDKNGRGEEGEEFGFYASPEYVEKGMLFNVEVLLVYPDGKSELSNRVMVTPQGLARMGRELGAFPCLVKGGRP